jgi:hypothetical protein
VVLCGVCAGCVVCIVGFVVSRESCVKSPSPFVVVCKTIGQIFKKILPKSLGSASGKREEHNVHSALVWYVIPFNK